MDLSPSTLWWVAAGLLVAAELMTGTFYLLMMALGLVAGGLAAYAGASGTWQLLAAAAVAVGATAGWHLRRQREPDAVSAQSDPDVILDIGDRVQVTEWAADGTTRVAHRGTQWAAQCVPGAACRTGAHVVVAVHGNALVLKPADT